MSTQQNSQVKKPTQQNSSKLKISPQQDSSVKRVASPEASNKKKRSSQHSSKAKNKHHHSHKQNNDKETLKTNEKSPTGKNTRGTLQSPSHSKKPCSDSKDTKTINSCKDEGNKVIEKSNGESEPKKVNDIKSKDCLKQDESQPKPEKNNKKRSSKTSIKESNKRPKNNSKSLAKDDSHVKKENSNKRTKENGKSSSNSRGTAKGRLGSKVGRNHSFSFRMKATKQSRSHKSRNNVTGLYNNQNSQTISDQLRLHRLEVMRERQEITDKIKKEKERLMFAQMKRLNHSEPNSSFFEWEYPFRRLPTPGRGRSPSHDMRMRSWDREQDDLQRRHLHRGPQSRRSVSRSGDMYPEFPERISPSARRMHHRERNYDRLSQASDRSDFHNYDRSNERVFADFSDRVHSRRDGQTYSRGSGRNSEARDDTFDRFESYREHYLHERNDGWPPRERLGGERGMRSRSRSRSMVRLHRSVSRGGGINYTSRSRSRSVERYKNREHSNPRSRSRASSRSHSQSQRRYSKMEERRPSAHSPETNRKRRRSSSNKEEALSNLWEIHSKECDMYRKNPDAHPDYDRTKRDWMAEKIRLGFNTMDPTIHVQWVQYWLLQMEELFKKSWEEKKTECLMLLFSKSLVSQSSVMGKGSPRRRRSVRSNSLSSSNSSRSYSSSSSDSRPSRKKSKKKKHKKKSKKSKKSKHSRRHSEDERDNPKTVDELAMMDDLESRVNDFIEKSRPRDRGSPVTQESPARELRSPNTTAPSASPVHSTTAVPAPGSPEVEALLDLTSYLSQLSDRLGALAVSLSSLHDRVTNCIEKGQDPLQCIDSDAKALLDCTRNKLVRILEQESVTPVQNALYQEANHMIDKFLNSLKDTESPSIVSSDLQVIAKMTVEMKMPQVIAFIKNLNSKAGVDLSSDELMRTYLEIKRIQRTFTT